MTFRPRKEPLKICEHGYILLTCRACMSNLLMEERLSRNNRMLLVEEPTK